MLMKASEIIPSLSAKEFMVYQDESTFVNAEMGNLDTDTFCKKLLKGNYVYYYTIAQRYIIITKRRKGIEGKRKYERVSKCLFRWQLLGYHQICQLFDVMEWNSYIGGINGETFDEILKHYDEVDFFLPEDKYERFNNKKDLEITPELKSHFKCDESTQFIRQLMIDGLQSNRSPLIKEKRIEDETDEEDEREAKAKKDIEKKKSKEYQKNWFLRRDPVLSCFFDTRINHLTWFWVLVMLVTMNWFAWCFFENNAYCKWAFIACMASMAALQISLRIQNPNIFDNDSHFWSNLLNEFLKRK